MINSDITGFRSQFLDAYKSKKYKVAIEFGNKIMIAHNREQSPKNMVYCHDLLCLADAYSKISYHELAIPMFEEVIQIYTSYYGETLELSNYISYLATSFSMMKKHDKAISLHKKVLRMKKNFPNCSNQEIYYAECNLANAYIDKNKNLDAALKHFKSALALCPKNSEDFIDIINYISNLYEHQENYSKAITHQKGAVSVALEIYTENSIKYMEQIYYLGILYEKNKDFKKASTNFFKVYKFYKLKFGSNNYKVAVILNKLVSCSIALEQLKKATNYRIESLEIVKNTIGSIHLTTIREIKELAKLHLCCDLRSASATDCLNAVNLTEVIFGANGPEYTDEVNSMFRLLFAENNVELASLLFLNIKKANLLHKNLSKSTERYQTLITDEKKFIDDFKSVCLEQISGKGMWRKFSDFFDDM